MINKSNIQRTPIIKIPKKSVSQKQLTEKHKVQYAVSGQNNCPYCITGSLVWTNDIEFAVNYKTLVQKIVCDDCGQMFHRVYEYVGIEK